MYFTLFDPFIFIQCYTVLVYKKTVFLGLLSQNSIIFQPCCCAVQSLSHVQLFATLGTAACLVSQSFTVSQSFSNSCPLSQGCYPIISSPATLFFSCLQSFLASGSFQTRYQTKAVLSLLLLFFALPSITSLSLCTVLSHEAVGKLDSNYTDSL